MLPLQRVFPHARLSESEAAERAAAIEAHRLELGSRLGRNVGAVVAAVDYLLNVSGELVSPTIVEHEALELLEHRSITDPLTGLLNRPYMDLKLAEETKKSRRFHVPLACCVVGLDDRGGLAAPEAVADRRRLLNEVAGIRMPDLAVPVASHTGWNSRHPETGGAGQFVDMMGSTIPFARSAGTSDPREPLEGRSGGRGDYLGRVRKATEELVARRHLLAEDVALVVELAGERYDALFSGA